MTPTITYIRKRLEDCISMHCIGGEVVRHGMKSDVSHLLSLLERCVPWLETLLPQNSEIQFEDPSELNELEKLLTEIKGEK